jgi:hypothetical protein
MTGRNKRESPEDVGIEYDWEADSAKAEICWAK